MPAPPPVTLFPLPLAVDVHPGDSVADLLIEALSANSFTLLPGDILVVKHKIVSKAEGGLVDLSTVQPSPESLEWGERFGMDPRVTEIAVRQARRIVRRQRGITITETQHGFICANSGVDVSNVDGGRHALLLPEDPDRSALEIHNTLQQRLALTIPVIITDTFGRPWREGLTEVAIGIAGMKPLDDVRGQLDPYGYTLHVSVEAVADELACAAGLVCGKLSRTPACVVRGFHYSPGPGSARELIRPAENDLFR
ncbi:MAG: coenzyme F420-0:L-glutamate ligase [Acidobacteriales bacterium]|nr:coenzyme F420-0:L-glutamate ligase [Terriglobales bacterium]